MRKQRVSEIFRKEYKDPLDVSEYNKKVTDKMRIQRAAAKRIEIILEASRLEDDLNEIWGGADV